MANTTYTSTEGLINKLKEIKGKAKLKIYNIISNYYDNTNIRMDEDPFAKNAQNIGKIFHGVILLMNFLQAKPQLKNMNIKYYDLYYTVIKNRDVKEIVDDQYENDFIKFNGIVPNNNISIKPRETTLR